MKKIFILSLGLLLSMNVFAQDTAAVAKKDTTYWKLKGVTGLNFSQAHLVNWSAGGDNTVSGNVYLNAQWNYKKAHWGWDNSLNTQFGMIYTTTNQWNKSVDNFQFTSKIGYTHNEKLYYSFLADFVTQYAKGYKSPTDENYISNIMAPGYLNLAIGIDYKPSKALSIFYSPFTERFTFVLDDSLSNIGAFGLDPGQHVKKQSGMYAKIGINTSLSSNIQLSSTADFFTPYDKNFGNIVVNWDALFSMKINKWLTTTLSFSLKYDDAVKTKETVVDNVTGNKQEVQRGAKIQFKEIFGLGIAYTF